MLARHWSLGLVSYPRSFLFYKFTLISISSATQHEHMINDLHRFGIRLNGIKVDAVATSTIISAFDQNQQHPRAAARTVQSEHHQKHFQRRFQHGSLQRPEYDARRAAFEAECVQHAYEEPADVRDPSLFDKLAKRCSTRLPVRVCCNSRLSDDSRVFDGSSLSGDPRLFDL